MNHIVILKHFREALLRIKSIFSDLVFDVLEAIQDIEENFALKPSIQTINLLASNWIGTSAPYTQTVSCSGVISNESKQIITVSADPISSNINVIIDCGIYCTSQGNNTLTFTSFDNKPAESVTFNITIQDL